MNALSLSTVAFCRKDLKNDQGRFVQKCHDAITAKRPNFFCASSVSPQNDRKTTANDFEFKKTSFISLENRKEPLIL